MVNIFLIYDEQFLLYTLNSFLIYNEYFFNTP